MKRADFVQRNNDSFFYTVFVLQNTGAVVYLFSFSSFASVYTSRVTPLNSDVMSTFTQTALSRIDESQWKIVFLKFEHLVVVTPAECE